MFRDKAKTFCFRKTPSILRFAVCNTLVLMGMCGANPGMTGILKEIVGNRIAKPGKQISSVTLCGRKMRN